MELREEGPQEQENASPTLAPMLVPPLDVEVIELDDDDEEHAAQGDGQPPLPPEDEPAGDGVSPPPMGWTVKVYHKPGCDTASHHRLVGILIHYYVDWNATVEYVCNEYTHPLEDTYWKTRVCIFPRDQEKEAYQLDRNYIHGGYRAIPWKIA
jgi:hypothetical protein